MLTLRWLVFLSGLFSVLSLTAQHDLYRNTGALPEELIKPNFEKYQVMLNDLASQTTEKQKATAQFALDASYSIGRLMKSGDVIYNEELTNYLNKIVDILLKNNSELRQKVRFYIMRSTSVNAFANPDGTILVTMGLLAMVQNEAQLAFIISHELIHVQQKHSFEFFIKATTWDKEIKNSDFIKKKTRRKVLIKKHAYRKEQETEADTKGFELFKNSGYSIVEAVGALESLRFAELPYDDKPFNTHFFDTKDYSLPDSIFLKAIPPRTGVLTKQNDSLRTHPNLDKRIDTIKTMLKLIPNASNTPLYLVSESTFHTIQAHARRDLPMIYLRENQFIEAFYTAYIQLLDKPKDLYLQKCIAKAVYASAKLRKWYNEPGQKSDKEETTQEDSLAMAQSAGNIEQVASMLFGLTKNQLTLIALRYTLDLSKQAPNDAELNRMRKDLFRELVRISDYASLDSFSAVTQSEEMARLEKEKEQRSKRGVGINISRYQSKSSDADPRSAPTAAAPVAVVVKDSLSPAQQAELDSFNYMYNRSKTFQPYIFASYYHDSTFIKSFAEQKNEKEHRPANKRSRNTLSGLESSGVFGKQSRIGAHLGIDKVLVVNPFYMRLMNAKDPHIKHIESEQGELDFLKITDECAKKVHLETVTLDPLVMNTTDASKMNDMVVLSDWVNQQIDYGEDISMVAFNQNAVDSITKAKGIRYILIQGMVSNNSVYKVNIGGLLLGIPLAIAAYPAIPWGIYYLFAPHKETVYLAIVFDTETGNYQIVKQSLYNLRDYKGLLYSQIYDALLQIKTK